MTKHYNNNQLLNIIKHPIITDKTTKGIENNTYVFSVDKHANKNMIKEAMEYIFNVKIERVNTLKQPKKTKTIGKFRGHVSQHKKAIIKLYSNYRINLFEEL
uniref:Ribosomal protein L23 n=1 Tax=Halydictyon mirabile TaxID=189652 RepID=A0A4D6WWG3_9FLOR|nr:ribosomal protein L23 [Halydictyon mirabile]